LAAQGGRTLVLLERQAAAALRALPTSEWLGPPPDAGSSSSSSHAGAVSSLDGGVDVLCRICLQPFEIGETLRWLPCTHRFHKSCVDHWLLRTQRAQPRSCPLCKHDPLAGLPDEFD
jgi:hypothetical protein